MGCGFCGIIMLAVFVGVCSICDAPLRAQSTVKPKGSSVKSSATVRKLISCPDPAAVAACKSFEQLLEARDADILDSIKPTSYVCFRPKEDVFWIFRFDKPRGWSQPDSSDAQSTRGLASLVEYRNGVSSKAKLGLGTWSRVPSFGGAADRFAYSPVEGRDKGLQFIIDSDEISVDFDYQNLDSERVFYSLQIRRSTGRFAETFKIQKVQVEDSGTCFIYK